MDSFELNKIIGAVLGTLLFVMGVGFLAEGIYHPIEDRGPGYALPEPEPTATADAGAAAAAPAVDLGTLLAAADATQGAAAVKKCQACHDFTDGGPNKTGPNLYDVVDRPIGSHPGFSYSDGMKEHNAKGDIWSYENLNAFITNPKEFTPGTKMSFSGVKDDKERANILAYLQTLSASPKPFPAPQAAAPAAGEQPAAEGAQPAAPAANAAPAAGGAVAADGLGTLLASANAENGANIAKKCKSCHDFTDGGPNRTGPNLYDVVDRAIGTHPGFNYSDGMKEHAAKGDIWSYENLDAFITSPKTFTPGTKMSFSGIADAKDRADLLAYLQTLSKDPKPFPGAEGAQPAAPAAPAPAENAAPATPAENATPAPATETPSTTQGETNVEGTPTNSEAAPAGNAAPAPTTTPSAPATPPAAPATAQ